MRRGQAGRRLLRVGHQRPSRRAAEKGDELAPLHVIAQPWDKARRQISR
jgi:hypothetical protein